MSQLHVQLELPNLWYIFGGGLLDHLRDYVYGEKHSRKMSGGLMR